MDDLLRYLLGSIVEHPEEINVSEHDQEGMKIYRIHVAQGDMGRVIGKGGKVIRAIRSASKIWAVKNNVHVDVEIEDERVSPPSSL